MTTAIKNPTVKPFLYKIQEDKNLSVSSILRDRKNVLDLNIVVLIDISGSISAETFKEFMKILDNIKGLSKIKVLEFSTEVSAMYDYYKTPQDQVMRLTGGGGTLFTPVFKKAKKLKPDAILIMTDCDNFDTVEDPLIPVGLILVEGFENRYHWMKKIGEVENIQKKQVSDIEEAKEIEKDSKNDRDELSSLEQDEPDESQDEEEESDDE